jgi:outer membrane protein, heavy metal efflux system
MPNHYHSPMRPLSILSIFFASIGASLAAERGALTLNQALALATSRSPDLAAFPYDQRAADARLLQAGLKPNPVVSLEGEDFLGGGEFNGFEQSQTTLSLGQLLELGGKRAARQQVARAGQVVVQFDYEAKRREVLRRTTEAFVEVLGAQRRVDLAEETAKLAGEFMPLIQERAAAGVASTLETARGEVALATAQIGVEQARRDLAAARRTLVTQWGAKEATFSRASGDLDRRPELPNFMTAFSKLGRHPLITRWDAEKDIRTAIVAREKANAKPDVTVSGGARWLENGGSGEPALVAGISIPLPFSNRNQGNIAEAQALAEKTDAEKRAVQAALTAQLGASWEALAKALNQIEILEGKLLPAASKSIDAATGAYQAGRLSQLEILDARRTLTDARIQALEARIAAHKAAATLDALTAASPDFADKTVREPAKPRK